MKGGGGVSEKDGYKRWGDSKMKKEAQKGVGENENATINRRNREGRQGQTVLELM